MIQRAAISNHCLQGPQYKLLQASIQYCMQQLALHFKTSHHTVYIHKRKTSIHVLLKKKTLEINTRKPLLQQIFFQKIQKQVKTLENRAFVTGTPLVHT